MAKTKIPLAQAEHDARVMVNALRPFCSRIRSAGSVRRKEKYCGDLEIVCIPRMEPGLGGDISMFDRIDWTLYGAVKLNGDRQKKIILRGGIQLDLFITTREQWGYILMLRTGPADFSHKMVTPKADGGFMPGYLKCDDGFIWSRNHTVDTPEEIDVFNLYGMDYMEPPARNKYK